jgi:hypothetical protein
MVHSQLFSLYYLQESSAMYYTSMTRAASMAMIIRRIYSLIGQLSSKGYKARGKAG